MVVKTAVPLTIVFRALADRTRLRIVHLLTGGELCVCDIVSVLDVPQPTASRHLAYLRRAGLVVARKEGLWHYYRLHAAGTTFQKRLWECLSAAAEADAVFARDRAKLRSCGCGERCK